MMEELLTELDRLQKIANARSLDTRDRGCKLMCDGECLAYERVRMFIERTTWKKTD